MPLHAPPLRCLPCPADLLTCTPLCPLQVRVNLGTGYLANTRYEIRAAAESNAGWGPNSPPLLWTTPDGPGSCTVQGAACSDPGQCCPGAPTCQRPEAAVGGTCEAWCARALQAACCLQVTCWRACAGWLRNADARSLLNSPVLLPLPCSIAPELFGCTANEQCCGEGATCDGGQCKAGSAPCITCDSKAQCCVDAPQCQRGNPVDPVGLCLQVRAATGCCRLRPKATTALLGR